MNDMWQPVSGTRFYSRNGEGLYERLTDKLFLRVDEVDENRRARGLYPLCRCLRGPHSGQAGRLIVRVSGTPCLP